MEVHIIGEQEALKCRELCTLREGARYMEVQFTPDLQAKLEQLAIDTGRAPGDLVEDVVAGYFDELNQARAMLNSRYDDLKSGRVKPIPGDEVEAYFREKSAAARRSQQPSS